MRIRTSTKGQSLLEILFALAVFTVGVVAIGYLIFDSFISLRYGIESTQARLLAQEGIEAASSLIEMSFDTVPAGTYGLQLMDNTWSLASSSDTQGIFSRTLTVTNRDVSTKHVNVEVTWDTDTNNQKSVAFTSRFTDWRQNNQQLENFSIDINNAAITASGTSLAGIALRNVGADAITVTDLRVWYQGQTTITGVSIRGQVLFTASSTEGVASGELLDIADYAVPAATGFHLFDYIAFNESVAGSNFILSFILADGSSKYVFVSL